MSDTFDASHAIDSSLTTPEATQYRWAATNKARTETGTNTVALSVRQRKLLMLLATPQTAAVLAERSNTPLPDVEAALSRFAALGLAESDAPRVASRTATTVDRAAGVRSTPTAAQVRRSSSTRLPLALGAVALVATGLAIWFFARPATQPTMQPIAAAPTLATVATAPTPAATTPQAAPASPGAPDITISPSPTAPALYAADGAESAAQRAAVAATAAKEAAAKAAAKDAAQAATKSAPTPAAGAEPRTPPAPTSVAALPPPPTSAAPVTASVAAPPTVTAALPPAVTTAQPTPTPAPATATPSPAAATSATATPAKSAAPVAREGRLLERVEPVYPRNVQYENGTVRARLSVNAAGAVTGVEIMSSNPPRVFDRSVSTALAQWKYEATGEASSKLVEVSFQR